MCTYNMANAGYTAGYTLTELLGYNHFLDFVLLPHAHSKLLVFMTAHAKAAIYV